MRYHLAEAIRISNMPEGQWRAAIDGLPLGTRTIVAVLSKHLQGHNMTMSASRRAGKRHV